MKTKRIRNFVLFAAMIIVAFFLIAYSRVWGKAEIEFKIHINEELVLQSVYGESPTFAIWLENPGSGEVKTVFVTNRAGHNHWEGKVNVPALPLWSKISELESEQLELENTSNDNVDAISGATPTPGYFTTRAGVKPGNDEPKQWICWIEMNLAGDYNTYYKEFDEETKITDEFANGQPALVYKALVGIEIGNIVTPEIAGMTLEDGDGVILPLYGITSATDIFDEITISVVRPKPRIISKK